MKLSKIEIGKELKKELVKGYTIERISSWACDLLVTFRGEPNSELDNILDRLSLMDAGPEFVYNQEELSLLAEFLIHNEKDPLKKINDIKFKR